MPDTKEKLPIIDYAEEAAKFSILKKNIEIRKQDPQERWRGTKSRIFIFPEEYSVIENLQNRRGRPYKIWKELLPEILEKADEKVFGLLSSSGVHSHVKTVWSQKAGCNCGCSPAFIVQAEPNGVDIFVSLKTKKVKK